MESDTSSMMESDTSAILNHQSTELVIFTHIPSSGDVGDSSQGGDLLQQQQGEDESNQSVVVNHDQCDDLIGLNKIVKGLDNVELYMCGKCNRTFKQKSRYERHIANHPSEKHYLCETCHKTFTRMSHLEKHTRTHTEERRHVCDVCGAAFILPHHLVRHNLIHSGVRPFQCEVCNKQFTRKAGLTQHQYVHTGIRPYVCDIMTCGKQFTDRTTLRRHLLTHSREKPFICKECDKTFRTKSACRKHYLRHFKGGLSFKCGVCEEMFKDEQQLKEHSEMHEEKQKSGAYRCGFCLRVFKSQEDLDSHVPLHETGLIHACNHCAAKFYTHNDLLNHMSKHFAGTSVLEQLNSTATSQTILEKVRQGDPSAQSQLQSQQSNEMNKLLVVLQLPPSLPNLKDEQGTLQVENIQQLLGTARIEKLVVTTDPIANSSQTLALELSQDQQQSIQQILQTTNVIQSDDNHLGQLTEPGPAFPDLTAHDTLGDDDLSSHVQSSFVLKSISNQPPAPQPKNVSQYLIVPPTGGNFSPLVHDKNSAFHAPGLVTNNQSVKLKLANKNGGASSLENSSVFKSPPSAHLVHPHHLQLLVHDPAQEEGGPAFANTDNPGDGDSESGFPQDTITINQHTVSGNKSQTSAYFQHTEYGNALDGDLLTQDHTSDYAIVSN